MNQQSKQSTPSSAVAEASASNRGRKSRTVIEAANREKAAGFVKRFEAATKAIEAATTKVGLVLERSSTKIPAETAQEIVSDAVAKALSGISEKAIWEAVIAREKARLDELTKFASAAK